MPEFPGSPALPLDEAAQDAKFRACCASAQPPVPPDRAEALIRRLRRLEDAAELREIVALLSAADSVLSRRCVRMTKFIHRRQG